MLFVIVLCFFMVASCQAQVPVVGPCPNIYNDHIPNFNVNGILGQWFGYAAYPDCDPPGRCRRTEFITDPDGTVIADVKQLSTAPNTFDIYQNVNSLRYNNNATFAVARSKDPRNLGEIIQIFSTDYTSYLIKRGCKNFGAASLHYAWILTRSPNPPPSVVAKIHEIARTEGTPTEYLTYFNQTDCPAKY